MSAFSKADYDYINLGVCIENQADRLGIEHDGVPLEGVVVRIAEAAIAARRESIRLLAAGVVAEEPGWEYSWAGTDDEGDDWVMDDTFDTRESAEAYTRRPIGGWVRTDHGELVRRRKAGPWVAVRQEGAENDGLAG